MISTRPLRVQASLPRSGGTPRLGSPLVGEHSRVAGDARPVQRLRRVSVTWRLVAVALCLAVLTVGQLTDDNDLFPLGSLSQYATARDPNGTVASAYVEADTVAGTTVRVPLDPRGVGVGRAEIENQVDRIVAEPALLQSLADAHAGLHPDEPRYTRLVLYRTVSQLRDGRATGEVTVTELARWDISVERVDGAGADEGEP